MVERRLFPLNRPTWFIASWNYLSDAFGEAYGRGILDITGFIRKTFVEVRFGNVAQDKVRSRHPSCLIVDPNNGESRILGSNPGRLRDWYSGLLREKESEKSGLAKGRLAISGVPGIDPDAADFSTERYDAYKRAWRDRERGTAQQKTNPGLSPPS